MKKTFATGLMILVIVGFLSVIVWGSKGKQVVPQERKADQISATPSAATIDANENMPTFFYGNTCPHCQDVEVWMEENNIEEKLPIVKKEVYENQINAQELSLAAQKCGLNTSSIGVPFLYTADQKCLIGTPDITAYLLQEIKHQEVVIPATETAERSLE